MRTGELSEHGGRFPRDARVYMSVGECRRLFVRAYELRAGMLFVY